MKGMNKRPETPEPIHSKKNGWATRRWGIIMPVGNWSVKHYFAFFSRLVGRGRGLGIAKRQLGSFPVAGGGLEVGGTKSPEAELVLGVPTSLPSSSLGSPSASLALVFGYR